MSTDITRLRRQMDAARALAQFRDAARDLAHALHLAAGRTEATLLVYHKARAEAHEAHAELEAAEDAYDKAAEEGLP